MLQELKNELNYTYTENGALTYDSTLNHCVDLFATIGGLRNADENEIIARFVRAYAEKPDIAMKVLFYARDVRGGLGERRIFRILLRFLSENHAISVKKNIRLIAEYGRFDDILVLMDTPCEKLAIEVLEEQLIKDVEALNTTGDVSLLAKWLPSVNTSNKQTVRLGRKLAKAFGMTEKEYRKTLSSLRKQIDIIENYLRETDYSFDYEKQCSQAMLKYRKAFNSHDKERYTEYLNNVLENKATMHTGTLMPYEIITPFFERKVSEDEAKSLDVTWNALENYAGDENALVVIDGSGSMYGGSKPKPAVVAQSLGLYFAERNKGKFANHFITFSEKPKLVEVKGKSLSQRLQYIATFNEVANTNIQAVFDLILKTAVKNKMSQKDMPKRLIIVSDMEFDTCVYDGDITNFEYAKRSFEAAGYELPKVVFWNVASRKMQVPVTENEQGVTLVSGCNARLFEQIVSDKATPYEYMMDIIGRERYERIVA